MKTKSPNSAKDYERMGRMIEDIFVAGSSNFKRLIWYNFVKGLAYGLGIFLAGTVVVGLLIWFFGLFDQVPVIGPAIQQIIDSLDATPTPKL